MVFFNPHKLAKLVLKLYKILKSWNVPFGQARYIQIFDVISTLNCVLLGGGGSSNFISFEVSIPSKVKKHL